MREWRERREDRREKRGCMRGEERKGEERRGSLRPRRRALIVNAHGMHCLGVAAQRNILYYIALYYISIILVWYYVMVCYIIIIIIIIIIIMLYIYIYIYMHDVRRTSRFMQVRSSKHWVFIKGGCDSEWGAVDGGSVI